MVTLLQYALIDVSLSVHPSRVGSRFLSREIYFVNLMQLLLPMHAGSSRGVGISLVALSMRVGLCPYVLQIVCTKLIKRKLIESTTTKEISSHRLIGLLILHGSPGT